MPSSPLPARTFRLPALAYLAVLLLLFGVIPLAFTADGAEKAQAVVGPRAALLLIPVVAAVFIARTATIVDERGIRVRAAFGQRVLPWDQVRGLTVDQRNVLVVVDDGAVRLPCVSINDLAAISRASGGHLPELAEGRIKQPPTRRMRRRR